jgi:hypothetical protein
LGEVRLIVEGGFNENRGAKITIARLPQVNRAVSRVVLEPG